MAANNCYSVEIGRTKFGVCRFGLLDDVPYIPISIYISPDEPALMGKG